MQKEAKKNQHGQDLNLRDRSHEIGLNRKGIQVSPINHSGTVFDKRYLSSSVKWSLIAVSESSPYRAYWEFSALAIVIVTVIIFANNLVLYSEIQIGSLLFTQTLVLPTEIRNRRH